MDVLYLREKKLNSKIERDHCVEARTKFLAQIALELRPVHGGIAATYLNEANMLRHTEYGVSGSMFPKNSTCEHCGTFWQPNEVSAKTKRHSLLSRGRIAKLRRKENSRPWMLTRFQKRQLKQQDKYLESPTTLELKCLVCDHKVNIKLPRQDTIEVAQKMQCIPPSASVGRETSKHNRKRKLMQLMNDMKEPSPEPLMSFLSKV